VTTTAPSTQTPAGQAVPGPRGKPVLGSILDFRRDIMQAFIDGWREYGDAVKFRGPLSVYLFVHPDYVDHILHANHRNYRHPDFEIDKLRPIFGNGLVLSQGDFWRRQRRLSQPAFHRQRIASFASLITETTGELLERWEAHADGATTMDVREEFQQLTLRILTKALFSTDVSAHAETIGRTVTLANEYTNRRLLAPVAVPERLPLPQQRRFVAARDDLDAVIYGLISERRSDGGGDHADLLSMLLEARDEETGESMNDQQLHDEVVNIFIAGHETVSLCLTWTAYLLSRHPEVERRVRAEVDEALDGRVPTVEDVPNLTYTTYVLQESLRLYPPIWNLPRQPIEDDEIGGYRVGGGEMIFLIPYITHRHPAFWDNPEGFDPERFAPERSEGRPRYAYFPFGGGPRQCIGNSFAMLEMQLSLPMLLQRYSLSLAPGHPVALEPMVTLRPKFGMLMTARPAPRAGAAETPS
jgi:cytochrome P450